ncbi:hypothetical protein FHG87_025817 [Trinorchestia longiramus]|nr:hypothetical protein FHG87_025817 [Trinorchestia longiramus]
MSKSGTFIMFSSGYGHGGHGHGHHKGHHGDHHSSHHQGHGHKGHHGHHNEHGHHGHHKGSFGKHHDAVSIAGLIGLTYTCSLVYLQRNLLQYSLVFH